MENDIKHRRKTLIVNRKLQFTIIAYMTAVAAMASLITSMSAQVLAQYALVNGPGATLMLIIVFCLVAIVCWSTIMLLFSNRIFGPIFRIHREIKNWRDGKPVEQIHLRKGDHLTDLIDDFNELVDKHAPKVKAAKASEISN